MESLTSSRMEQLRAGARLDWYVAILEIEKGAPLKIDLTTNLGSRLLVWKQLDPHARYLRYWRAIDRNQGILLQAWLAKQHPATLSYYVKHPRQLIKAAHVCGTAPSSDAEFLRLND